MAPSLVRERFRRRINSVRAAGPPTSRFAASASVSTGSRSTTPTMSASAEWNAAIYSTASCQRFGGGPVGRVGPSDVLVAGVWRRRASGWRQDRRRGLL